MGIDLYHIVSTITRMEGKLHYNPTISRARTIFRAAVLKLSSC